MKRRIVKLGLFLLLGAIINVAVAWGLWSFHDTGRLKPNTRFAAHQQRYAAFERDLWSRHRSDHWPRDSWPPARFWSFGIECTYLGVTLFPPQGPTELGGVYDVAYSQCGIPWKSLSIELWEEGDGFEVKDIKPLRHNGIDVGAMRFPIHLRPTSFIANTIVYAGILWMIVLGPGTWRRFRASKRIKRGLCPACGYDLRGRGRGRGGEQAACPECGHPSRRAGYG